MYINTVTYDLSNTVTDLKVFKKKQYVYTTRRQK